MWQPEIVYEEGDGASSRFPFIPVPAGQEMPKILYIIESRDTGERERAEDGEEYPVVQMDMHQYADMLILKRELLPDDFDKVRLALGLEPLSEATRKGEKITETIRKNLE